MPLLQIWGKMAQLVNGLSKFPQDQFGSFYEGTQQNDAAKTTQREFDRVSQLLIF